MKACTYRNDLDTPTAQREAKAYATLAAQFALHGLELVKGDPEIVKQAPLFAVRYGQCRPFEGLDAARAYLERLETSDHVQSLQEE